jgi:hypothetical protein
MDPRVRPADDGKRKMILPRRNQLQTLRTGAIPIAVLSDFKGLRRLFHRTRSSSHGPSSLTMSQCIVVIKSLKVRACGSVLPARPAAAAIDKRKSRVRPFGKKMSSFQKSIAERGISNHKGRPKRTCRRWPISRSSRSAARRRARHGFERQPDSVRTGDDCLQRSLPCICYHPLFVFNQGSAIWNAPLSVPAMFMAPMVGRPRNYLQAPAGSQRHFSLVKVSDWTHSRFHYGRHLANVALKTSLPCRRIAGAKFSDR